MTKKKLPTPGRNLIKKIIIEPDEKFDILFKSLNRGIISTMR